MPSRVSESFVLQTYPFKEGDLIVSFLTRDFGKLRGVARRARRPKSGFGSGLERLSQIQMSYFQRENRDLVSLDSCEIVQSQFSLAGDPASACALDFFAEVTQQMLPDSEPAEKYFRLLETVIGHLRSRQPAAVWRAVTYFCLWTVRLAGLLPELHACLECGNWLEDPENPRRAYFNRFGDGLLCEDCRRSLDMRNSWELEPDARLLAKEMLRTPVAAVREAAWPDRAAASLRRFLVQRIESQIERKLITFSALEAA